MGMFWGLGEHLGNILRSLGSLLGTFWDLGEPFGVWGRIWGTFWGVGKHTEGQGGTEGMKR